MLESLFNNVTGLKASKFIKKRLQHRYFLVKFAKFLITFFEEYLWTTALYLVIKNIIRICKIDIFVNQNKGIIRHFLIVNSLFLGKLIVYRVPLEILRKILKLKKKRKILKTKKLETLSMVFQLLILLFYY